ncbi:MATE family efflux transporter [Paenibacillus qinlingensis]|uniref:MATE family efflux transporter n=1 Tax=Paenibacillus qinlingensis TaxID=1837343 RepID=UPI00156512EE|nr:MATE family efflux transporter [Paenibacillus qinlingensis]NQX59454.1 MATE family efflux transporter [Paenibacillus qinlingensis]
MKRNYFYSIKKNKSLFLNIVGSIGIKGLSMLVGLLTLSESMNYFSDRQVLGVWFVLVSILTWILTFDFGIGNGLRNYLVEAFVEKDTVKVKRYISSAYFTMGVLSLTLIIVGYIFIGILDWNSLLNIEDNLINNKFLIIVIRIMFIGIGLQFFLKLILSVLYAMQKTALSNLISLISNTLILIFVMLNKTMDIKSSLLNLSIVYILAINIPLIVVTIVLFINPLKKSKPNLKYLSKEYANKVLKLGYMFFWVQLSLLIINLTNEFLIARLFGPEYIVEYQVYNRFFMLFLTFFSILTIPIWSEITKAYKEKRIDWIRKMYKYLNFAALAVCIICFSILPVFQYIVNLWMGSNALIVDIHTAFLFATFNSLMVFIYAVTCIANGIGNLKTQLICNTIAAVIKIPLTILLSNLLDAWTVLIVVNIIIMLPSAVVQPLVIRRQLNFVYK